MKKVHVIGGILTTACGKQLEEVKWVGLKQKGITCKSCLKHQIK